MTMRLVAAELVDSREILPGQWLQSFHAPAQTRAQPVSFDTQPAERTLLREPRAHFREALGESDRPVRDHQAGFVGRHLARGV